MVLFLVAAVDGWAEKQTAAIPQPPEFHTQESYTVSLLSEIFLETMPVCGSHSRPLV
jgi:hypothetical protein